jgi:dolichyl-diphosphooligosaccharide--protein glycosyltransferase
VIGTLVSMTVTFVSFIPVSSPEHMPAMGVFGLVQLYTIYLFVRRFTSEENLRVVLSALGVLLVGGLGVSLVLSITGGAPLLTGRLLSLLGSTKNIAIVNSVSEHQPSSWTTFWFDFHLMTFFIPVGLYHCFRRMTDGALFIILYTLFSSYFASIMVRLVLVMAPAACVMAAIGVSELLNVFMDLLVQGQRVNQGVADTSAQDTADERELQAIQARDRAAAAAASAAASAAAASTSASASSSTDASETVTKRAGKGGKGGASSAAASTASTATTGATTASDVASSDEAESIRRKIASRRIARLEAAKDSRSGETAVSPAVAGMVLLFVFSISAMYVVHCTWVTSVAYSSPSVVLAARNHDGSKTIFDDFREAYQWLARNTAPDAKIASWWDYGYQIKGMGNRTVIVDNNTRNNSHIATIGLAMASNEEDAYPIFRMLDVDYVLVVFGGKIGYSSDDINKFLWMVRISSGVFPRIVETDYFNHGSYRVDAHVSHTMKNSMMYKMCYHRFGELMTEYGQPTGFDRVRRAEIGDKYPSFKFFEEAFTSEHWMVRIYRVLRDVDDVGHVNYPRLKSKKSTRPGSSPAGSNGFDAVLRAEKEKWDAALKERISAAREYNRQIKEQAAKL